MAKTSIFYYTNNLMTKDLLSYTLKSAIKHCKNNGCELILTSHFPLAEDFIEKKLGEPEAYSKEINGSNGSFIESHLYDYIVKDILIKKEDVEGIEFKNFVVGKLPYALESIIKQLLLSMEECSGDNITFFEHDCLYPDNYIPVVERALVEFKRNIAYCLYNVCYLNFDGYFKITEVPGIFLLGCSGKKSILKEHYQNKLKLFYEKKSRFFEPVLHCHSEFIKSSYPEEIIIPHSLCIDKFLGEGHSILNVKHKLNADGYICGKNYFHTHPYWGNDDKYLDMIKDISKDDHMLNKWSAGTAKLNY